MKPILYALIGCLFFFSAGCRMKEKSPQHPSTVEETDPNRTVSSQNAAKPENAQLSQTDVLPPVDTTLTAQEIRDSIQRIWHLPPSELSAEMQLIRENIVAMWNTDDTVYIHLISANEKHIRNFKKLVFHSPRISLRQPAGLLPRGILLQDTSLFSMRVEPNVYPPTAEQIEISITNYAKEEGMAGSDYHLEYYNGTEWVNVPQNYAFTALGYPIASGHTRDGFTATLYPQLSPNLPGQYRVYKTVSTGQGKTLKNYVVVAPFYISDRPEDYTAYTTFVSQLYIPKPTAEFKGGQEALKRFFRTHLRYPEKYKGTGTRVRLFYSFVIDSTGRLQNPESRPENLLYPRDTEDSFIEFREEALRVLRLMPAWEPAVNRIHGPRPFDTGLFFNFEEGNSSLE